MSRLNASPVGEKPSGEMSTTARALSASSITSPETLRTTPVCWKSTPSMTPSGRAVMKLPEITLMSAFAIGVLARPCENAASISRRISPFASFAHSSAARSVTRTSLWNAEATWRMRNCSSICGREPWTTTMRMPSARSSARSSQMRARRPATTASPLTATTKILRLNAWT